MGKAYRIILFNSIMIGRNFHKDILLGLAIGDALGVPVEFLSRKAIAQNPVTGMRGFGTHKQPPGTFSDDSSLAFCLAEALTQTFDLNIIAQNFLKWYDENYWTATGEVFDIGGATNQALRNLRTGGRPELAGGQHVADNGNGSLMRILPLVLYIRDLSIEERFKLTRSVSSITHGHIRSVIACFYYLEFARLITEGIDKFSIYEKLKSEVKTFLLSQNINKEEIILFDRLLNADIFALTEDDIHSSGYVLHTLEASIWCLLTSNNYEEAVLKAVNLGQDTDTTATVAGGLAGLLYGHQSIPTEWIDQLARRADIEDLADRWQMFAAILKS